MLNLRLRDRRFDRRDRRSGRRRRLLRRFVAGQNGIGKLNEPLRGHLALDLSQALRPAPGTTMSTAAGPPRVVALSSMGADRTSGVGNVTALSLLEQGLRSLPSPVAFVRAGGFFENFLYGLQAAQGGTLPVFYNPTNGKSTMVAAEDIGREAAALLSGPAWSGHRVIELGSMVSADEVARQLGEVLALDVKAFAIPRAGWPEAFEQLGIPMGHTGPAEEMFEGVNAGWMDLGIAGTEHVAGTTSARDVFAAARNAVKA